MLDQAAIQDLANQLENAERTKKPVTQFSVQQPDMTIDDAYAVQVAWRDIKIASGRRVVGRKIGLTSRTMQKAQEVDEPDRGVYFDDQVYVSGARIETSKFIWPRVEVEVAFELSRPLRGPNITVSDVMDATAWVYPALELLDARIEMRDPTTGGARKIVDAISDNAANAGIVTGGSPTRPDAVDLRWIAALLYINGTVEESGVSAAVMNHPAAGVAWLANSLAPYGEELEAGQPILSGSFTRPVFVHPGDTLHAEYRELGAVTCEFV